MSTRTTSWILSDVARPPDDASVSTWVPLASSSQKIGPEPMNSAGDPAGGGHVAAGVAAEVEDELRLAGVEVGLQRVVELARGVVREAGDVDVADGAVARSFVMTSFWTMTSRTIGTSNGAALPRSIVRTTVVPFLPRTLSRAASTVRPSRPAPSILRIASPATRPAFWAGEPSIGDDDDQDAVGAERGALARLARGGPSCRSRRRSPRTGRTGPAGLAGIPRASGTPSTGRRATSTMPRIAPWISACWSTSPPA